jgi:hypothetical protein
MLRTHPPERAITASRVFLRLEALEARDTPAGNVSVILSGTQLVLVGDGAANALILTEDAAGNISIQGSATAINGLPSLTLGPVAVDGVQAILQGGNDTFFADGLQLSTIWSSDMGHGTDFISLNNIRANQLMFVQFGPGPDTGVGRLLRTDGDFTLSGGGGTSSVDLAGVVVGGNMAINTQEGKDAVTVTSTSVFRELRVSTAASNDFVHLNGIDVGNARVLSVGEHDDVFIVNFTSRQDLGVDLAAGDDFLWLAGVRVDNVLFVSAAGGRDVVQVTNVAVGVATSFQGGGDRDDFINQGFFTPFLDFGGFERFFF